MKFVLKIILLILLFPFFSCRKPAVESSALFELWGPEKTGITFSNDLKLTLDLNIFNYMYFFNGGGVGAGDFNNDGNIDLFFTASLLPNRLYLNEGELKFRDVTDQAGIFKDGGWSNGVSVVDINHDGKLDIYVAQVGDLEKIQGKNQLFICREIDAEGIPHYEEKAAEYGLDFKGFSTQATFFDYDGDGDLDMFLLNHSLHANGTFGPRASFIGQIHPISGDKLFRNDGQKFTDVTAESGIQSTVIGYGLGVTTSDVNLDGFPDIYVGNDFHENDYLYINQGDGTFREELTHRMNHTSRFSMGVDIADLNNDAWPEVISLDMLPSDPEILKKSEGEDAYKIFHFKLDYGYNHQYARNNLQLNNGNGTFSEIGLYADVFATDWSWASLLVDFDNDGRKDLFVSNGIPKRMNDTDYINFIANDDIQWRIRSKNMMAGDLAVVDNMPEIKLPNEFLRNEGDMKFSSLGKFVKNNQPTYSNGAVYADLDNDGDLDFVVNNINDPAYVYENLHSSPEKPDYLKLTLQGDEKNPDAIGAKVLVYQGAEKILYENFPVRGFQSSMAVPLLIGLGSIEKVDSLLLIWPDNSYQKLAAQAGTQTHVYAKNLPQYEYRKLRENPSEILPVEDITAISELELVHKENPFLEFDREPLLPHMNSTEGPALAVGDVNKDGLEDLYLGSSKRQPSRLMIQQAGGKFVESLQPDLLADSMYEDIDAIFADVNGDSWPDLLVASGGNEYYNEDSLLLPRLYLGDSAGKLRRKADAFDRIYTTASCITVEDFTQDKNPDVFIGGRVVPWKYGEIPTSHFLVNDGTGKFTDQTEELAPGLSKVGMVTSAEWFDLDKDGDKDLLITLEWDGILCYVNQNGRFEQKILTDKKGWWNFVLPGDLDNDGDIDLIAGNLGLNSRLKASEAEPVRMYFQDFDDNGTKEQLLTTYLQGREIPFANMAELTKQMPPLKKKYLYAADFAKDEFKQMFDPQKIRESTLWEASYFSSSVLINRGDGTFETTPLPWQSQLTPYRAAVFVEANGDNLPDILLGGNFYENNIQLGRYDADFGTILINRGNGKFEVSALNNLKLGGQVRKIRKIFISGKESFVLARNNDTLKVIQFKNELP
ncbi:MAG: VCBS repeat-containing protein [Bacteroidia bacterium]|nr:VCBS repeat-containing protein [Bacteroidia bacterium]